MFMQKVSLRGAQQILSAHRVSDYFLKQCVNEPFTLRSAGRDLLGILRNKKF